MKFNIANDCWINVIREDGTLDTLGLRDVLAQAHQIRAITDPMPTVEFGLYRLLVAFVLDIFQPKKLLHWDDLWEAKAFDQARVEDYFEANADCFELFDEQKPFLQTANVVSPSGDVSDKKLKKPLAVLLPLLPTGVNATHFHHQHEEDFGVCAAAAARLLVAVGPFAINEGPGPEGSKYHMPSSINKTSAIFVLPTGKNLWETLLFNTPVQRQALKTSWAENDIPAWRDPTPPRLELKSKFGLVEGLTWRPRQVRLLVGEEGVCSLTGTTEILIKQVLWAQGFLSFERLTKEEKKEKKQPNVSNWQDPNIAYFTTDNSRNIITYEEGKELWRDTAPLLLLQESDGPKQKRLPNGKVEMTRFDRPAIVNQWAAIQSNSPKENRDFRCNVYWLLTNKDKQAKVEQWQRHELSVGAPLLWKTRLHNEAQSAMEEAEKVFYCLKWAIKKAHRQFGDKDGFTATAIEEKVKAGEALPALTDKKNPSRYYAYLRRIEDAGTLYWRELRPHYDALLDSLAQDEESALEIEKKQWLAQVQSAGWEALKSALDDLDGTAEELERQTRAYKVFARAIFATVNPEAAAAQRAEREKAKKEQEKNAAAKKTKPPAPDANGQLSLGLN